MPTAHRADPVNPEVLTCGPVSGVRYRLELRLTAADVGKRVVIRWRPGPTNSSQMKDVLGILEQADTEAFTVRTRDEHLIVIPRDRALAGKVVPQRPPRRAVGARDPSPPDDQPPEAI